MSWFLFMMWGKGPNSFFGMLIFSCPCIICWINCSFPIEWSWHLLGKQLTMYLKVYFYRLSILFCWSIFLSLCQYYPVFYYYSSVVSFEIGKCESLQLHINFRISFSISAKKAIRILIPYNILILITCMSWDYGWFSPSLIFSTSAIMHCTVSFIIRDGGELALKRKFDSIFC